MLYEVSYIYLFALVLTAKSLQGNYHYPNLQIRQLGFRLSSEHKVTENEVEKPEFEASAMWLQNLLFRGTLPHE